MPRVSPHVQREVERAFEIYVEEVNRAPLKHNTKITYTGYAEKFVRWLKGDFEPGIIARQR